MSVRARLARLPAVSALLALLIPLPPAFGNGGGLDVTEALPTRYERFVLTSCVPCVRETYPVAKVVVGSLKLPGFPRMAGTATRPGEVDFDVNRAYQIGRASRQLLALRVTLSIAAGTEGEMFRLGLGLLDEEEVVQLTTAMSEITQAASLPADSARESTEVEFHSGSLRIGLIHFLDQVVAYVQVGNMATLALRPVWEVPSTLYLPVSELPSVAKAVGQAAAKLRQLRGP